ncbi:hypothetical protein D1B17_10430 [Companilactobacillus zhachilii]|uniref:Beta-1,6-galactofuranosyltransferase n=1 Tax=Companilactobacillus zhachilii TaxID=2304606 RepID=A0A386PSQ5_9LACO|nr:hypothetical protein [Companilactobacillus zhachilii]AYE39024.1 hypothetical protein D1B17_10430 [Companilactobacillus zhachilii]
MNKYVTKFFYGGVNERNAGPKAKDDVNFFLNELGFKNVDIHLENSKLTKLFKTDNILKKQIDLNDNGIFVLQYPLNSHLISNRILKLIVENKKFISIALIHDLNSLRNMEVDENLISKEINYLNHFDYLIVHNIAMKNWLIKMGFTSEMIILNLFDYRSSELNLNNKYDCDIVYAGNLIKAEFLKNIELTNNKLNIYGSNELKTYPRNVFYKGSLNPDELPQHLNSRFGLVWDGDSVYECSGVYGHYLEYNTPHKISLYLSAGIPVIVWKKSAMAEYIVNNKLGISVDSLDNIENILNSISDEEYSSLKRNALSISEKLRSGYFIHQAISKILSGNEDFN